MEQDGESEFEKARTLRIAQNQAKLAQLQVRHRHWHASAAALAILKTSSDITCHIKIGLGALLGLSTM